MKLRRNKLLAEPPGRCLERHCLYSDRVFPRLRIRSTRARTTAGNSQDRGRTGQAGREQKSEVELTRTVVILNGDPLKDKSFEPRLNGLLADKQNPGDRVVMLKSRKDVSYERWIFYRSDRESGGNRDPATGGGAGPSRELSHEDSQAQIRGIGPVHGHGGHCLFAAHLLRNLGQGSGRQPSSLGARGRRGARTSQELQGQRRHRRQEQDLLERTPDCSSPTGRRLGRTSGRCRAEQAQPFCSRSTRMPPSCNSNR